MEAKETSGILQHFLSLLAARALCWRVGQHGFGPAEDIPQEAARIPSNH